MRWGIGNPNQLLWHGWFAWHPVVCEGERVWLEDILRRWNRDYKSFRSMHMGGMVLEGGWEYKFRKPRHPVPVGPILGISGYPA